jgi:hypothetical protein
MQFAVRAQFYVVNSFVTFKLCSTIEQMPALVFFLSCGQGHQISFENITQNVAQPLFAKLKTHFFLRREEFKTLRLLL